MSTPVPRTPVADGVAVVPVRSPTLPPATHTNAYVLGDERVIVVDPASPWADEQARLAAALTDVRVDAIFLTHHHHDHVGGVVALAQATGAPILAHPLTADRVDFAVDRTVVDGDTLDVEGRSWHALHTPGHATGHLCLWDPQAGTVVAGDMIAGVGTIVLDPPEGDLGAYMSNLERLRDLDAAVLLPAHGPAQHDARGLLDTYLDHRRMRTGQYLDQLVAQGPCRPIDVVPHIYPELPQAYHPLAARQVLCHMLWLCDQGQVRAEDDRFAVEA